MTWKIEITEQKVVEKEKIIESNLNSLDDAYQMINGKHLIHQVLSKYTKDPKTLEKVTVFRNLLTRNVKGKVHSDITTIINQRILSSRCDRVTPPG